MVKDPYWFQGDDAARKEDDALEEPCWCGSYTAKGCTCDDEDDDATDEEDFA